MQPKYKAKPSLGGSLGSGPAGAQQNEVGKKGGREGNMSFLPALQGTGQLEGGSSKENSEAHSEGGKNRGSHHKPDDGKCPLFCRDPTDSLHLLSDHLGGPCVPELTEALQYPWEGNTPGPST